MSTISAGLVSVTNLTVTGTQAGAIQASNLSTGNFSLSGDLDVGDNLTLGGTVLSGVDDQLAVGGVQYTYPSSETNYNWLTLQIFSQVPATLVSNTQFAVKIRMNRVGNQVTLNFPSMSFNVPYLSAIRGAQNTQNQNAYLMTVAGYLPEEYRPSSYIQHATVAPNGTYNNTTLADTIFIGGIADVSGNSVLSLLTVTQHTSGFPLKIGTVVSSNVVSDVSGVSVTTGTTIQAFGTGKGGKGTYYVTKSSVIQPNSQLRVVLNDYSVLPVTMPGYLVQVGLKGDISISGVETTNSNYTGANFSGGIPVGPNTVLPFSISYTVEDKITTDVNFKCSSNTVKVINTANWPDCSGFTTVDCSGYMNYTGARVTRGVISDNCLLDSYNGVLWNSWSDNSTQTFDASGNAVVKVADLCVRKSTIDAFGNVTQGPMLQITKGSELMDPSNNYSNWMWGFVPPYVRNMFFEKFGTQVMWPFGTSVAINRINPNIISASMQWIPTDTSNGGVNIARPYFNIAATSQDGGNTWPAIWNKPMSYPVAWNRISVDSRGIQADMYGNFWYNFGTNATTDPSTGYSNAGNLMNLACSKDGINFYNLYSLPAEPVANPIYYDSPAITFGYDQPALDASMNAYTTTVSSTFTGTCVDASGALTLPFRLNVASTTKFVSSGVFNTLDASGNAVLEVFYTAKDGSGFTGCIATAKFTSFTIASGTTIKPLGQYGIWCENTVAVQSSSATNIRPAAICFIPITGRLGTEATFTGTINDGSGAIGNILTVTSVASGTVTVGQQLNGENLNIVDLSGVALPYYKVLDPTTKILSAIDASSNGVGTYRVSIKQLIASEKMFGAVSPIGQLGSILKMSGGVAVPITAPTVTVRTDGSANVVPGNPAYGTFNVTVDSTAGCAPIGFIQVQNDSSGWCDIGYNGCSATQFLNCYAYFHGAGNGFTIPTGSTVRTPNSPAYLLGCLFDGVGSNACAKDGRMFYMGQYTFNAKSVPNKTFPDIVSSNWSGIFAQNNTINSYGSVNALYNSIAVTGYRPPPALSNCLIYDDYLGALYALYNTRVTYSTQNVNIILIISRDNGQTWCDPIYIRTETIGNAYMQQLCLDPVTGSLCISWFDGRVDPTNFKLLQWYCSIITRAQLIEYIGDIPYFNPKYINPPSTIPVTGGMPGMYGQNTYQ